MHILTVTPSATLRTICFVMMLVGVLNVQSGSTLPPVVKEGTTLSPSGPGLQANHGKAVLMTVAQRPNVSQRRREKLARLSSLNLATEFSMWNKSKWPVIGGLHMISGAYGDLL